MVVGVGVREQEWWEQRGARKTEKKKRMSLPWQSPFHTPKCRRLSHASVNPYNVTKTNRSPERGNEGKSTHVWYSRALSCRRVPLTSGPAGTTRRAARERE